MIHNERKPENRPYLMAFNQIMFELSYFANIIVMVVYWSLIHPVFDFSKFNEYECLQMLIIHILPGLSGLLNYLITDIVFLRRHTYFLLGIEIVYLIINYVETKRTGKPLYDFLTWES